jgi:hypothetical protein
MNLLFYYKLKYIIIVLTHERNMKRKRSTKILPRKLVEPSFAVPGNVKLKLANTQNRWISNPDPTPYSNSNLILIYINPIGQSFFKKKFWTNKNTKTTEP